MLLHGLRRSLLSLPFTSMLSNVSCRLLTISVDDGHPSDLRVAEMLARVGLAATFYIPERNPERPLIHASQVREIAARFEVGSHTINHCALTRLQPSSAWEEIFRSKLWVEDTISRPSVAFCYPRGKHNETICRMVRRAGFSGARTAMLNLTGVPPNPFRWGVSTQALSHSSAIQIRHGLHEANIAGLCAYAEVFRFSRRWDQHFRRALDWVESHGGIAHLFLHGWEIEEQNEWKLLSSVLDDAASRMHLHRITNGELFRNWDSLHSKEIVEGRISTGSVREI